MFEIALLDKNTVTTINCNRKQKPKHIHEHANTQIIIYRTDALQHLTFRSEK